MPDFLEICEKAARAGGRELLAWREKFKVHSKGGRDMVSDADFASQKAIREIVLGAFPDHAFLGEEETPVDRIANAIISSLKGDFDYRWIVDPLDGTANYVHGLAHYSVSVALERRGELLAGVVYDPVLDECYSARAGGGAHLNGEPLRVSSCDDLSQALLAASFAANVTRDAREVQQFLNLLPLCQAMRRMGSAALNLAYVAAGRLDAYWSLSCKSWDVAAGLLLVREAGGIVSGANGGALNLEHPEFAVSATTALHQELLKNLKL